MGGAHLAVACVSESPSRISVRHNLGGVGLGGVGLAEARIPSRVRTRDWRVGKVCP